MATKKDAAPASDRDALLSAAAEKAGKARGEAAWNRLEALKVLETAGRHHGDDKYKASHGVDATVNGFPCTFHNGVRVCLRHAVQGSDGAFAFEPATTLDAGR